MTLEEITNTLRALIKEERTALLTGQIDLLEGLSQRKLALLEQARDAGISAESLSWAELRAQNARNGALIAAAQRGLQEARTRLQNMREGGMALKTYDRQGRSVEQAPRPSLMTKRA